jgi:hypothetical protein
LLEGVKRYYSGERGRLDRFRRRPADGTAERVALPGKLLRIGEFRRELTLLTATDFRRSRNRKRS